MLYNKNTNCILLQKKLCRQLDSKNHVKDSYDMRECESSFGCKPEFEKKKKSSSILSCYTTTCWKKLLVMILENIVRVS